MQCKCVAERVQHKKKAIYAAQGTATHATYRDDIAARIDTHAVPLTIAWRLCLVVASRHWANANAMKCTGARDAATHGRKPIEECARVCVCVGGLGWGLSWCRNLYSHRTELVQWGVSAQRSECICIFQWAALLTRCIVCFGLTNTHTHKHFIWFYCLAVSSKRRGLQWIFMISVPTLYIWSRIQPQIKRL